MYTYMNWNTVESGYLVHAHVGIIVNMCAQNSKVR